jgi:hypothetical protein
MICPYCNKPITPGQEFTIVLWPPNGTFVEPRKGHTACVPAGTPLPRTG